MTDSGGGTPATTDANGVYTLTGLTPGSHSLTASATSFGPATLTATVSSGGTTTGANFSLTPSPGAVTGTVTSASGGAPIAGATVTDSGGGTTATADANGLYTLSGLTPGSHTLTASATNFITSQPQTISVTSGGTTQGVNFTLSPSPGSITGTVTSASGGAAIAGATVTDSAGGTPATTHAQRGLHPSPGQPPAATPLTASATNFISSSRRQSPSLRRDRDRRQLQPYPLAGLDHGHRYQRVGRGSGDRGLHRD